MANQIPGTDDVPDVTPKPLAPPFNRNRATPEAFGADAGNSLNQAGELANQVATRARENANLSAVLAARGTGDTALNQQILDDRTGFRSLRGHDAMAASDKVLGNFDSTLQKIGTGLANDDQRRTFAQYALSLKQEAFRHVQGHLAQETQIVDADSYKMAVGALVQRLGALPVAMDPTQQKQALDSIEISARARAVQVLGRGASPEEIANFTVAARAKGVDQILETLLANENVFGALERAKDVIKDPATMQLLGGVRVAAIEGRISRRADQQEGQAWARTTAQSSLYPGTTIISEAADEKLRKLEDLPNASPGMLKVAADTLELYKKRGREVQNQRVDAAYTQGIKAAHDGDDKAFQRAVDVLSVENSGPESGQRLRSIYEFKSQLERRDAHSPETLRQQSFAWNDAQAILGQTRASDTTLDAFLSGRGSDGRPLAESLSSPDLKRIGNEFQKKLEHEAADKPLDGAVVKQIATTLQEALDFPTSPRVGLTDEQIAQRNHIQDHVRGARNQWMVDNPGKQPGAEDYQGWINEETGKVPGSAPHWYNHDLHRVDLELQQAAPSRTNPVAAAAPAAIPPQPTTASPVAPAPAAAPPAKRITAYRYSKDRSQRIPVYDDGTQGHPEPNQ